MIWKKTNIIIIAIIGMILTAKADAFIEPTKHAQINFDVKNQLSGQLKNKIDSLTRANGIKANLKYALIKTDSNNRFVIYSKIKQLPFYGLLTKQKNGEYTFHLANQSIINIRYIEIPSHEDTILFFAPEAPFHPTFIITKLNDLKHENSVFIAADFLYLGLLFGLFVLSLIFYFVDKIRIQLLHAGWAGSIMLSMTFTTNAINVFIQLPAFIYSLLELILYPAVNTMLLLMIKYIINSGKSRIKIYFNTLIYINLILVLLITFSASVSMYLIVNIITLFSFIFSVTVLWIVYKNDASLKYFLIGFLLMLISMIAFLVFKNNQNMQDFNKLIFQLCSASQCVLFFFGIQKKKQAYNNNLYQNNILNLQMLMNIREKISRDLHDDIGSSLSSISIYTEAIKQNIKLENKEKALQLIEIVGRSSRNAILQLSEISWLANPKYDKLINLLERLEVFGNDLFEGKDIRFLMTQKHDILASERISLNINEKKNIYLIVKELLNNIAKHSNANEVKLLIEIKHNIIIINLEENGSGYNFTENSNGNGLKNIIARAKDINAHYDFRSERSDKHVFTLKVSVN